MGNSNESADKGKIVALSDTHLGDHSELLIDSRLVDRLCDVLAGRGQIGELVLLGDVVDLWVNRETTALGRARYFIESICALPNITRIVYVPGNHDHQMFMFNFYDEMNRKVRAGDLSLPHFLPARSYPTTLLSGIAGDPRVKDFSMAYPFIVRRVAGRKVVLSHGHHLDFFDRSFGWARTYWLARYFIAARGGKRKKKITLQELELANLPFYGAMAVTPWVPEIVIGELRFYSFINFFARLFRKGELKKGLRRDTLIQENYKQIGELLPLFDQADADCFVFGHTHRPGVGRVPDSSLVVGNTGSWVRQEGKDVPSMTWIELDDKMSLYQLTETGPGFMGSESLNPG